jgi:hypothetical protein
MSCDVRHLLFLCLALSPLAPASARAQGTAFTYQGRLTAAGLPAEGPYEMRFALYGAVAGGAPVGGTLELPVTVADGAFSVLLDFGACPACFDGAPRFLEIGVRPSGSPDPHVLLEPRQEVTPAPYAMRSTRAGTADLATNAAGLEGVPASGFIRNGAGAQPASFNVTGNGVVGGSLSVGGSFTLAVVNATTRYELGGQRVLAAGGAGGSNLAVGLATGDPAAGGDNAFVGFRAGALSTTATLNAFFGSNAGTSTTTGGHNAFFGAYSGWQNTTGIFNSFFGRGTGGANTSGSYNASFGAGAGDTTTTGSGNTFVGTSAGNFNVAGDDNSFFGREAGRDNVTSGNSFFGRSAGRGNTTGSSNTFVGFGAGLVNAGGTFNTFVGTSAGAANAGQTLGAYFGAYAGVASTACCNAFFGAFAGSQNTTGSVNAFFGQGTGALNTVGFGNAFFGQEAGSDQAAGLGNTVGSLNTFLGNRTGLANSSGNNVTLVGAAANVATDGLSFATALGAGAVVGASNSVVLGRAADTVRIPGNLLVSGTINGGGGGPGAYILNGTSVQTGANFSIDGVGAASAFDGGEIRLGGVRFLSTSAESTNLLIGNFAGGPSYPTGSDNVIAGTSAGRNLIFANGNVMVGAYSGLETVDGSGNVFVGNSAGGNTTSGNTNTFVGGQAGQTNETGKDNTIVGYQAFGGTALDNSGAIGAHAQVTQANSLVLGSIAGVNNATADTRVGIGTTAPRAKLEVAAGDVYLNGAANGVILRAPNGACFRLTVANGGALATAAVACP